MDQQQTPQAKPATDPIGERVYERFQRWRRREEARWNGLFTHALIFPQHAPKVQPPPDKSLPASKCPTRMTVEKLRNARMHVLINGSYCVICDGCGALLPIGDVTPPASSDSTLAPSRSGDPKLDDCWARCNVCTFVTPLGTVRRLLRLPPDAGPQFCRDLALALLVEGVGVEHSMRQRDPELQSWFLDKGCRMSGLDALFGAIGIREEQVVDSTLHTRQEELSALLPSMLHYAIEAEKFLEATIPESKFPAIPFSVADIYFDSESHSLAALGPVKKGRDAAERAAVLAMEAVRIWQKDLHLAQSNVELLRKGLLKMQALGREYSLEQTRARMFHHSALNIPEMIQVTQSRQPSGPSSNKEQ